MVHPLALLDEVLDDDLEDDIVDFLARWDMAVDLGRFASTLKLFEPHTF